VPFTHPLPPNSLVSVDVLDSFEKFLSIKDEWNVLFAKAVHPVIYLSHTWLQLSWQRRNRSNDKLRVIMVRENG
jgi:hypothetical protein